MNEIGKRRVVSGVRDQEITNAFMRRVYQWMSFGLGLTAVVAYWAGTNENFLYTLASNTALFIGLIVAELAIVVGISWAINKISATVATGLFLLYSALNGLTLAPIFAVYELGSIYTAFFSAGGMFLAMSLYGLVTKRDLTGMGSFMFMGLVGIIIASLVNFFLHSGTMSLIISVLGVFIFAGLTAFDTQKLMKMGESAPGDTEIVQRVAILGALTLYLDFINMFIFLLRLLGNRE